MSAVQFPGVLVSVDAHTGTLRRYITEGGLLMTHEATLEEPCSFGADVVEAFRLKPEERFRIHSATYNPPPPAGGTPVAAKIAA